MLPCYPMLKNAGLLFNGNRECKAIAMYNHSGEKDQVKNSDFMELMLESNRHQELIHKKIYCIICHLQFDKDVVFNIHNGIVYKIRKLMAKRNNLTASKRYNLTAICAVNVVKAKQNTTNILISNIVQKLYKKNVDF